RPAGTPPGWSLQPAGDGSYDRVRHPLLTRRDRQSRVVSARQPYLDGAVTHSGEERYNPPPAQTRLKPGSEREDGDVRHRVTSKQIASYRADRSRTGGGPRITRGGQ